MEQNGVSRVESASSPPLTPEQRKALAGQSYRPVVCPHCGRDKPRVVSTKANVRYYRCTHCNLDEGRDGTGFKVPIVRTETRGR